MPGWRFWRSRDEKSEATPRSGGDVPDTSAPAAGVTADQDTPADQAPPRTATAGTTPPVRPAGSLLSPERRAVRLGELRRRRDGLLFDIERGEEASRPDNPWAERIALLRESLATVDADRAAIEAEPPAPTAPVPPLPIQAVTVTTGDPATVTCVIDGVPFAWAEATDWDNRGGMVVRGDLRRREGDVAAIASRVPGAPSDWPTALGDALDAWAIALRDRALDGDTLPRDASLRDVITEDREVGGWRNTHGTNPLRVQGAYRRQELRAERDRLDRQIAEEEEERRTLVDRLPIARRRLAGVREELAALGDDDR
jgi:hypothetical protein